MQLGDRGGNKMNVLYKTNVLPKQPVQNFNGDYVPDGFLQFPDEFLSVFYPAGKRAGGFVNITDDGTTVLSCEWNEEAYQDWCVNHPELDILNENKSICIAQSKADLTSYLETHPLQWTDGEYYSITEEKQNQLTSTLVAAQVDGKKPEWNSTGLVCKEWELEDLAALGVAIKDRVKKLVKYQQEKELEIKNSNTLEELDLIVVDYNTVE